MQTYICHTLKHKLLYKTYYIQNRPVESIYVTITNLRDTYMTCYIKGMFKALLHRIKFVYKWFTH